MKYTPHVERLGFDENYLDLSEMVEQRLRGGTAQTDVVGHVYSPAGQLLGFGCQSQFLSLSTRENGEICEAQNLFHPSDVFCFICSGFVCSNLKTECGSHKTSNKNLSSTKSV